MNEYFTSQYLNVIDLGETSLLFNGTNGCLDEVSKELGGRLSDKKSIKDFSFLGKDDISFLAKRGHITHLAPEVEWKRFRDLAAAIHNKKAAGRSYAMIKLLMSYNCNLDCKYCYQRMHRPGKSHAVMSEALLDSLFENHLPSLFPGVDIKNTKISFYGGEPFLSSNEKIVRKALFHAKKHGMQSGAITNATMVDSMPDIFGTEPGTVSMVQVSLDGNREEHDNSRVPISGGKTFDRIIENIKMLLERGTKVNVRLNLDKRTIESIPPLLEELKSRKVIGQPNCLIYASPLQNNMGSVDDANFMDVYSLSTRMAKLGVDMEHPVSLRANEMSHLFGMEKGLGLNRTAYCMQSTQSAIIVDPFGDLYSCFEEAGHPEYRIGSISAGKVKFYPLLEKYRTRHIANMEECVKCSVALACGGQCGAKGRTETGDLLRPYCPDFKATILESVKCAYMKNKKESKD